MFDECLSYFLTCGHTYIVIYDQSYIIIGLLQHEHDQQPWVFAHFGGGPVEISWMNQEILHLSGSPSASPSMTMKQTSAKLRLHLKNNGQMEVRYLSKVF